MRGWFLRRKLDKDQKGFSLIEMVIAIPLLALSGGFVVSLIAQSFGVVNTNQAINNAGVEVQNIMDEARSAKTCFDLEQIKGDKTIKKFTSTNSHPTDFTITTTFDKTCATYGASSQNQVITVTSKAWQGNSSTGKVLFKNQTSVLISG